MVWLIWCIRSWFCAHKFKQQEATLKQEYVDFFGRPTESNSFVKVSATCTKCGWHRSYKKY